LLEPLQGSRGSWGSTIFGTPPTKSPALKNDSRFRSGRFSNGPSVWRYNSSYGSLNCLRQILETEEHVPIPPIMYSDPFYRITYLIKEEIRKYKWIEGEKGRKLSWERARQEWTDAYREKFEKFLIDTLYFPDATPPEEPPAEGRAKPGMATATGNATSSQT